MRELTNEIDQNYLTYYFKDDTAKKRFEDFNNGIEHLKNTIWWNEAIRSKKAGEHM